MKISMNQNRIYIQAADQISIQQPISEQWMETPISYNEPCVRSINPNFREYLAPNEARRLGNLIKRALVTTLTVLRKADIEHPDAIITGTCLGSLDYTERLLHDLCENGEESLSPTYFMQSTHNTVGSTLGIYTKTKGYNTTYSHSALSFDCALLDAWMQMKLGKISNALVGGHDEMTEECFGLQKKIGFVGVEGMDPCGEVAVSMMLNNSDSSKVLCEIAGISLLHKPTINDIKQKLVAILGEANISASEIGAVVTGKNGNKFNDKYYSELITEVFPNLPLLHYKHLFGEHYTSSAFGVYAAAHCIDKGYVPSSLYDSNTPSRCNNLHNMLILNQQGGDDYSIIILRKV